MATESHIVSRALDRSAFTPSSQSDIALVPYARLAEGWTLKDSILLSIARACQQEGTFKRVFYEGHIRTPEDFLEAMKKPANLPVFAFRGLEPLGFAWLNGLTGTHGFAHFCMLKNSWGHEADAACQMFLDYWMSFENAGEPILSVILGVIQKTNSSAVRFAERLGFVRLGSIPEMLRDAYTGNTNDAVVLYYLRSNHGRRRR